MNFIDVESDMVNNILRGILKDDETTTLDALKQAYLALDVLFDYLDTTENNQFLPFVKALPKDVQSIIARSFYKSQTLSKRVSEAVSVMEEND